MLLLVGCMGEDDYFWIKSKTFPMVHNKEGELIEIKTIRHVGQYNNFADISQSYQGPIKGAIVDVWKVTRIKGGKNDLRKMCGERPKELRRWSQEEWREKGADEKWDRAQEAYWKIERKRRTCVKKHQAKDKANEKTRYYYARTLQSHKIVYPQKAERHSHWELTLYGGRVGDLSSEAIEPEELVNISQFRTHLCSKWGSSMKNICFDLPGKDHNAYYTIREVKYSDPNRKREAGESLDYHPVWEDLYDVRISVPTPWIEIEGMEIDANMYKHLEKECHYGEKYCHLDKYKGSMTKEQQAYVKKVSWK